MRRSWTALPLVGLTLALPAAAGATVIDVTTTADVYGADGKCSLREATLVASGFPIPAGPGQCPAGSTVDTINLPAGTYQLSDAASNASLYLMQTVSIAGAGAGTTVIEQKLPDRVLHVFPGGQLEISGVTVTGGRAPGFPAEGNGGGILNEGDLTVRASAITGNRAADGHPGGNASGNGGATGGSGGPGFNGGGIASTGPSLLVEDSVIAGNRAGDGGAGGTATVSAAPAGADGGAATGGAGGSGGRGGGVWASIGLLRGSWVHDNRAGNGGAGGGATGGDGGAALTAGGFHGGAAAGGAGGAGGDGGGLAGVRAAESTLSANASGTGGAGGAAHGGAGSDGALKGAAGGAGAGATGGAGGNGGNGAGAWEAPIMLNATITANAVAAAGAGGAATGGAGGTGGEGSGAFPNGGAGGAGGEAGGGQAGASGRGAIWSPDSAGHVGSSTVDHNSVAPPPIAAPATAGSGGRGGRAATGGSNGASGPDGPSTAGAAGAAGMGGLSGGKPGFPMLIDGTIVAANDGAQCLGADYIAPASSLTFGPGPCDGAAAGDPLLGPLEDQGGPTPVRAPAAGSPAIDPDVQTCRQTDQRGVARPAGATCDSGAYEATAPGAATGDASAVTATGATLAGSVMPMGRASTFIEYGPTAAYGSKAGEATRIGLAGIPLSLPVTGLAPATTYHYRAVASSAYGTATGEDRTFTTPAQRPSADTTAPGITSASIAPKRFKASKAATVRFTLSEAAALKLVVSRRAAGRKVKGRCRKPTRANRARRACTRWVKRKTLLSAGVAGANAIKLPGAKLKPGRHRVVITATDAAGNRSAKVTLRFKIRR